MLVTFLMKLRTSGPSTGLKYAWANGTCQCTCGVVGRNSAGGLVPPENTGEAETAGTSTNNGYLSRCS